MARNLLFLAAGLLAGFVVGFILANSTGTRDAGGAATQAATAGASNEKASSQQLSEKEIRDAIQTTDARPEDVELQKRFGMALYAYANQTRDPRFLPDAARFLKRAVEADPNDRSTTVSLANLLFDLGQLGDAERFKEARTYYQKALELDPKDVNARTDLGLTYYLGEPSDPQSAIREYRKSLEIDPRHELTLQNLATALIKTGSRKEAEKTIETLRGVNPKNDALSDLEALLAQSSIKS
ncbi:MAG: tetratricopeptide repeat protein [Pyrinomonadaceae bacterium]|nr:tetratricopeptide repeat protein [Pyrinomonadaceae bacterium]